MGRESSDLGMTYSLVGVGQHGALERRSGRSSRGDNMFSLERAKIILKIAAAIFLCDPNLFTHFILH